MIDIAMDGPVIDGTWYNSQTGDSFTVRDSFFQDSQLVIQATDGRMFDYNTIQNYVKSDRPIPKSTPKSTPQPLPKEVSDIVEQDMLAEDLALINGTPSETVHRSPMKPVEVNEDDIIINRILSRVQGPDIKTSIEWSKFPFKQFDMLVDMMGVEVIDIAKYLVNKIDFDELKESLLYEIEGSILNSIQTCTCSTQETTEPAKLSSTKSTVKKVSTKNKKK